MRFTKRTIVVVVSIAVAVAMSGCGHLHGLLGGHRGSGVLSQSPANSSANSSVSSPSGQSITPSTALATSQYPNGISPSWLSSQIGAWSGATQDPLILSPTLAGASYDNVSEPYNTTGVINNELSMLEATGAQAITIDLGYDPWLSNDSATIAKDTSIINSIRSSGHLVVIKDASAERYRHSQLPWSQFVSAWVQRVKTIAALFHPDYYTVIKEPPWYAPMIAGLSRSNINSPADQQVDNVNSWTSLLSQLITAVKSVSPSTKVGIAVDGNVYNHSIGDTLDMKLMQAAVNMPGLGFLGFDIYTANAFYDTQAFLKQFGTGGKAIWINEAWSTTAPSSSPAIQAQLDPLWAQALLDFTKTIGAQGVSPFYTNFFASYQPPPTSSSALLSFYNGRTSVFDAFKNYETQCHSRLSSYQTSTPC